MAKEKMTKAEKKLAKKAAKEEKVLEGVAKYNRVSPTTNFIFSLIFFICAACCVIPLIFVIIISFTSKVSIAQNGYTFWPSIKETVNGVVVNVKSGWDVAAYSYLWKTRVSITRSFFVSIFITVVGTIVGLILNSTIGYVLSRKSFKLRSLYTYIVFIPMVFYGGMVANYIVVTRILQIQDTFSSLILPLAVTSFYVIILRTFFTTTVPDSLIESGKIDGAGQLRIFVQIVLPISLPAMATIGLFLSFAYWNDWWNALMYIRSEDMYPLQYVLISIEKNMDFMIRNADKMGMAALEMLAKMPKDGVKMALVVIAVVPIACSYPFFQKYFISGLTIGAVKG